MQKLRNVRKEIKDKKDIRHLYNEISYKHASQILQVFLLLLPYLPNHVTLTNFTLFFILNVTQKSPTLNIKLVILCKKLRNIRKELKNYKGT